MAEQKKIEQVSLPEPEKAPRNLTREYIAEHTKDEKRAAEMVK